MFTPPVPVFTWVITYGIDFIIVAMIVRAFASWFNFGDRFAFIRFLARVTDPFITPVRKVIRPIGVIDIAFLVAWFLLLALQTLLLQALPAGW
ncbi:MAG TPA: YggT family protein [Ktedonobacteraceae bacterium]|jgi:YggT family protein|nr:YggT family protein [Ktedonobacteraceae bacterium]